MEVERTIGVLDHENDKMAYIVRVMVPCDPTDNFRPHFPVTCNVNGQDLKFHRSNPKTGNAVYKTVSAS